MHDWCNPYIMLGRRSLSWTWVPLGLGAELLRLALGIGSLLLIPEVVFLMFVQLKPVKYLFQLEYKCCYQCYNAYFVEYWNQEVNNHVYPMQKAKKYGYT